MKDLRNDYEIKNDRIRNGSNELEVAVAPAEETAWFDATLAESHYL